MMHHNKQLIITKTPLIMNLFYSLGILFVLFGGRYCNYKRWTPNANFGNRYNWDSGMVPCGNNIAVFGDDSPAVYIQLNNTVKEVRFPSTDMVLILDSDTILGFMDTPDDGTECFSNGEEVKFNKTYPSDWFDPKNWCTSEAEDGNCTDVMIESEMIPCSYDDVIFPKDNLFYVNVERDTEINVKTLKITGKTYSTNTLSAFMNSELGLSMFPKPHTGERSKIRISRRPCTDPIGCFCGNDNPKILDKICSLQKPYCQKVPCKNPIQTSGGCCDICGAKMTGEYGTGFRFDTLKNGLQRMYLDKRSELEDVQFVVSRTFNDKIQIVLTDKNGGVNSNNVATLMKADIDKDIKSGGFKYSLRKIAIEKSGPPIHKPTAGASTGGSDNGGKTAGIVILILIIIGCVGGGLFFIYKKKRNDDAFKFKMFDRISFRRKIRKPRLEVPPIFGFGTRSEPENMGPAHQGFENPVFRNTSNDGDKMNMEMMPPPLESEEQPTFDMTGFDNPLYDTYVQESPFSDPTKTEPNNAELNEKADVTIDDRLSY